MGLDSANVVNAYSIISRSGQSWKLLRSDALTSAAALLGIAVALWGGPGWESADDWAALLAAFVIALDGFHMLRPAIHDLMDRMPDRPKSAHIAATALGVEGVRAIEKLRVRKVGMDNFCRPSRSSRRLIAPSRGPQSQRQGQRGAPRGCTRRRRSLDSHGAV